MLVRGWPLRGKGKARLGREPMLLLYGLIIGVLGLVALVRIAVGY